MVATMIVEAVAASHATKRGPTGAARLAASTSVGLAGGLTLGLVVDIPAEPAVACDGHIRGQYGCTCSGGVIVSRLMP